MALKETERSLRWYFLLAGTVSALLSLRDISTVSKLTGVLGALPASWQLAIWFPIVARLVIGVGYIAAGVKLKAALPLGATWIKQLLLASIVVLVIDAVLIGAVLGMDIGQTGVIQSIIGLLVTVYLLASVRRLADEALAKQPPTARVT